MRDLDKALADIVAIRTQIARETAFRGLGSATPAATGALALATAALHALWLDEPSASPLAYFRLRIATASPALALIGVETVLRSPRPRSLMFRLASSSATCRDKEAFGRPLARAARPNPPWSATRLKSSNAVRSIAAPSRRSQVRADVAAT